MVDEPMNSAEPDGFSHIEKLKAGDDIWVVLESENWLKRVKEITLQPDGSYYIVLEDGIEALDD